MAHVQGNHIMLVGPITGIVTLDDGSEVDVNPVGHPTEVEVGHLSDEQIEELAHRVSLHYFDHGHPDDIEEDDDGNLVQRPFQYDCPSRFAGEMKGRKAKGTPRKAKKD